MSTLETLILAHDRAVCMAPVHLRKHSQRLDEVPPSGVPVRLVEIGTHSRGSVFLDGSDGRFRIIELNGATSEAVHIYDPKNPLWYGRRVLKDQWTLCFQIAAENAAAGAPVSSAGALIRTWWAARSAHQRSPV